jgi:hypothetical protein
VSRCGRCRLASHVGRRGGGGALARRVAAPIRMRSMISRVSGGAAATAEPGAGAAAGPRRVQPLPTRLHWAVGECVTAIEARPVAGRRVLGGQAMGRQVVKGANAQQFREAETITVEFEPERRKLEDDETAPT